MISDILWPKQQEAFNVLLSDNKKWILYGGSAGPGKSYLGCVWLWFMCVSFPGVRYFVGRNNLTDTRQSVLITWQKVSNQYKLGGWKLTGDSIKFTNGSEIAFIDLTFYPRRDPNFDRFGSKEYTGGWIEEGAEVTFGAFDVLKTRVGRHLNDIYKIPSKILITCNPSKNWLYNQFYKPHHLSELDNDKAFIQALYTDNPGLPQDYIDNLDSISDPSRRARLKDGNWEYDDDPNALIEYDAILDLWTNKGEDGQKAITADIAFNNDNFVIVVWDGWKEIEMIVKQGVKPNEVITLLEQTAAKHGVRQSRVVYDADGLGSYISGWLKTAKPFKNGSKPIVQEVWVDGKKEKVGDEYENLKTQCEFALAKKINAGQVSLTSEKYKEEVIADLEQIKQRDSDKDSKLKTTKKEDRKKILGRSPDFSDTLMMRALLDIAPKKRTYTRGVKV